VKKHVITITYAISLLASTALHAVETSPLQQGARVDGQRALVATRQMVLTELEDRMRGFESVPLGQETRVSQGDQEHPYVLGPMLSISGIRSDQPCGRSKPDR